MRCSLTLLNVPASWPGGEGLEAESELEKVTRLALLIQAFEKKSGVTDSKRTSHPRAPAWVTGCLHANSQEETH